MNSRNFLWDGGILLVALSVLGVLAPDVLGPTLWFDATENWAHAGLGVVALLASTSLSAEWQKNLTVVVGFVALGAGILGFLFAAYPVPNFYGVTNFEGLDNVLHLGVGVWALYAALGGKK